MIYLDNAATTYPKPLCVRQAVARAISCYGANPGRGGYRMAMETSEEVYRCRETAATLFGLSDERRVIFTPGCTVSLNTVIDGLLYDGGRVVVSDLEHNAVMRPLYARSPHRPIYDVAHVVADDDDATVEAFRKTITASTKAIVCTHASNVTGTVLPIRRLAALAHEHDIPIVVDAAQSAGHVPINVEGDALDYVCVAGHKGLYGPMGIGLLLCGHDKLLRPLIYGGTGSHSLSLAQPDEYPERLESGTPNVTGIVGLQAGMKWVMAHGVETIEKYEYQLCKRLYDGLSSIGSVRVWSPSPKIHHTTAVLSVTVDGITPDRCGELLAQNGVAVRTGLHCAPAAHHTIGTLPHGTVRMAISTVNTRKEIENCIQIFKKIAQYPLQFPTGL